MKNITNLFKSREVCNQFPCWGRAGCNLNYSQDYSTHQYCDTFPEWKEGVVTGTGKYPQLSFYLFLLTLVFIFFHSTYHQLTLANIFACFQLSSPTKIHENSDSFFNHFTLFYQQLYSQCLEQYLAHRSIQLIFGYSTKECKTNCITYSPVCPTLTVPPNKTSELLYLYACPIIQTIQLFKYVWCELINDGTLHKQHAINSRS